MYHKTLVIGNLGGDPELRYLPNGDAVCNFSVAVTEGRKNGNGGYEKHTTWYRVTAWGKQAENVNQYLAKGRQVYVEGTLRSDDNGGPRIFNRKDGSAGASYELSATTIKFLGKIGDYDGGDSTQKPVSQPVDDSDDMPF